MHLHQYPFLSEAPLAIVSGAFTVCPCGTSCTVVESCCAAGIYSTCNWVAWRPPPVKGNTDKAFYLRQPNHGQTLGHNQSRTQLHLQLRCPLQSEENIFLARMTVSVRTNCTITLFCIMCKLWHRCCLKVCDCGDAVCTFHVWLQEYFVVNIKYLFPIVTWRNIAGSCIYTCMELSQIYKKKIVIISILYHIWISSTDINLYSDLFTKGKTDVRNIRKCLLFESRMQQSLYASVVGGFTFVNCTGKWLMFTKHECNIYHYNHFMAV